MMGEEAHQVFILLGSNINPRENIPLAVEELGRHIQIEVVSTPWENPPVGSPGPNFYNAAIRARTNLNKTDLLHDVLRPVEATLGRKRTLDKNAPRTIDLDIILFDGELLEPRLWSLAFITVPMAEVLTGYIQPGTDLTLEKAAAGFIKTGGIIPRPEILQGLQ